MSIVSVPEKATKFPDASRAWKFITTQIPKKKRDGFSVESYTPTRHEVDIEITDGFPQVFNWNEISDTLSKLFGGLYRYKDELSEQIGTVEAELCDIEHACEFYDMSGDEGFRMYKMIHERRNVRRHLKNEYRKVSSILGMTFSDFASGKINEMLKDVDKQVYEPRALRELFYNNQQAR